MPQKPRKKLTLDRIARAHAARMAAEFADFQDATRDVTRVDPGLGQRGNARVMPAVEAFTVPHADLLGRLPRTSDGAPVGNASPSERGGARGDADALRPSADPTSWMGGAAGSDANVTEDPATGVIEKAWKVDEDDGSTTVHRSVHNPQDGSHTSTRTRSEGGREVHYIRITDNQDGTSNGTTRGTDARGVTTHEWSRDASGRLVQDWFLTTDHRGRTVEEWDRGEDRRRGFVRIPTDDQGSALGRRLGERFSHGAQARAPEVTKVNPGEPDNSGPQAERINPGQSIVINPAGVGSVTRDMSAARAKHMRQMLRDKVGGHVNPPGPGKTGGK